MCGFCAIPVEGVLCVERSRAIASEQLPRGAERKLRARIIPARAWNGRFWPAGRRLEAAQVPC